MCILIVLAHLQRLSVTDAELILNQEHSFKKLSTDSTQPDFSPFLCVRLTTSRTCVWTLPDLQGLTCSLSGTKKHDYADKV